jgi:hypothetical protein
MSRKRSYCEKYQRIIDHGDVELYDGFYGNDSYGNKFAQISGSKTKPASLRSIDVCNKNSDFKFDDKEKKLIDEVYNMLLDKYKFKKSKRHSKSKSKTIKKPKNKTNKRSKSKSKRNKKSKTKI